MSNTSTTLIIVCILCCSCLSSFWTTVHMVVDLHCHGDGQLYYCFNSELEDMSAAFYVPLDGATRLLAPSTGVGSGTVKDGKENDNRKLPLFNSTSSHSVTSELHVHPCFSNVKFRSCSKHQNPRCLRLSFKHITYCTRGRARCLRPFAIPVQNALEKLKPYLKITALTVAFSGRFPHHLPTSPDMDGHLILTCISGDLFQEAAQSTDRRRQIIQSTKRLCFVYQHKLFALFSLYPVSEQCIPSQLHLRMPIVLY